MLIALYLAIVESPIERVQGIHQKIFYIHVPTALVGYIAFGVVAFASIMYVWQRADRWDRVALSSAELGVLFTTLMLATGSIWGRPVWGAWWDWSDARLVTSLVMWLVYVAYLMFRSLGESGPGTYRSAAVIRHPRLHQCAPLVLLHLAMDEHPPSRANAAIVHRQAGRFNIGAVPVRDAGIHTPVRLPDVIPHGCGGITA